MDKKSLGRHFRQQRERLGISQEKLSERIGISPMYYSSLERGVRSPSLDLFVKIVNALGVSSDIVLEDMLECGYKVKATRLTEMLEQLPERERSRALAVLQTLISSGADNL